MNTLAANFLASFASAFSQSNRLLALRFSPSAGIADDTLLPWKLNGSEAMNDSFRYELTCLSTNAFLPLKQFIGQAAEVSILTDEGDYRPLAGWVLSARQDGSDGGMSRYVLVIQDLFAVLAHRINNRVFQDMSAKEAFLTIVREHQRDNPVLAASLNIDDRTTRDYPAQSWITQYAESDAVFGKRKLAEEGINFFFRHGGAIEHPTLTLVLFDDNAQLDEPATVRYHRADGTEDTDTITEWHAERALAPGQISATRYDYIPVSLSQPHESSRLDQGEAGNALATTLEEYHHDASHYGIDPDDHTRYARLRMQTYEQAAKCFSGESTVRALAVGSRFILTQHPEIDTHDALDRRFVLTKLELAAVNNLPADLDVDSDIPVFQNRFTANRDSVQLVHEYRWAEHTKPQAPQLLTATVVGPVGEEIHTDELGRIRVNLHFPRQQNHAHGGASQNETDSVWLRVQQPWTGAEYGALFLPRVGDEVIVGFIGGDIDRPIVIGTVYNGSHRPATLSHAGSLPGNKALSGIKSKMYKGSGANELVLDDTTHQLRARLATDHGHTALNQGYLVHPRVDGKAVPRGEGFELRTDLQGALRATCGLLISADARTTANGNQLDRQELIGQLEAALATAKQLAGLSDTHHADSTDTEPQDKLLHHLKNWEHGSNNSDTQSRDMAEEGSGGKPLIAMSGPAGLAMSTPQAITINPGPNLDLVTVHDTNLTLGQKLRIRAAESISLFTHKLGIKLIAASGKVDIHAHADNIEATAAKKILLTALEEIVIKAPSITHTTQGAGMAMGNGQITSETVGAHTEHAAKHNLTSAAAPNFMLPNMPQPELKLDERFATVGSVAQALTMKLNDR